MLHDRSVPAATARIVVYGGALLFVASLGIFLAFYLISERFGSYGGRWSVAAGWRPVAVDVALFSAFALHHSLFARTRLKTWVSGLVSDQLERSAYVWIASLAFVLVCVAWQPVPGQLWATSGVAAAALTGLQIAGMVLAGAAAGRIGSLSLAGIPQAVGSVREATPELSRSGIYGLVRHPIYLGWVVFVWAAPVMTGTRLVFAAVSTAYLIAAIPFEERDLHRTFGSAYAEYARHVRWRMLPGVY